MSRNRSPWFSLGYLLAIVVIVVVMSWSYSGWRRRSLQASDSTTRCVGH